MFAAIERFKIRLAVSVGWSLAPHRIPDVIRGFQATEADGVWHLYRGMPRIADPRQRAIVFGHCLEEESHADAFTETYKHYAGRVFAPLLYERETLYDADQPIWKTFAFIHVGEVDATQRFRILADMLPSGALKDCLRGVVSDEEGHVDLTSHMLLGMGATEGAIRREMAIVRLRRLWERWLRVGKRVVDTLADVLLSIVYFAFGLVLSYAANKKLKATFVAHDNNVMKRA